MAHVNDQLVPILEGLKDDDFRRFKFHLHKLEDNLQRIPLYRLESADRLETAILMEQYYPDQVLEVTQAVLKKIPRLDLVQALCNNSLKPNEIYVNVITPPAIHTFDPLLNTSGYEEFPEQDPDQDPDVIMHQGQLQSYLKDCFVVVKEGMSEKNKAECLDDIFVELFLTDGGDIEINEQHEIDWSGSPKAKMAVAEKLINPNKIFQSPNDKPIRTVLTAGIAGIGKTILVKKFVLDWAYGRQNQDIHFLFPFSFSELNLLKDKHLTFAQLVYESIWETKGIPKEYLQKVFTELQASGCRDYKNKNNKYKILFVLDGLDESRLQLDLTQSKKPLVPFDVTQSASVEVLLSALIRGELLPSARIWISTRPGAVKLINGDFVQRKTLVRGFNDPQKEEYFEKKFPDRNQANTIISHIKASRTLFIMCHIPVFCWITSIVLKEVLKKKANMELPTTLTEMYSEFLMYQITSTGEKCGKKQSIRYIKSLAKLAFVKLNEGNLFYEKDLKDSGIKSHKASLYVDVLTEVFEEVHRWRDDDAPKKYSFVHLSLMEYLAALHVVMSLINKNRNVLSSKLDLERLFKPCVKKSLTEVHTIAIQNALQSSNGQLDLFLRFLLGLSLQSSQVVLKPLLKGFKGQTQNNYQETIESIQTGIRENTSTERTFNLFYCLNELKENSLVNEIQQYLNPEILPSSNLTPLNWQALVFFLVSSEKTVNEFDLRKYCPTEEGLLRLLPVVKASKKSLLVSCKLSQTVCLALAGVLCSESSILTELDLSDNELKDAGAKRLSSGLRKGTCALKVLRLSGCMISADGCKVLALALKANPSNLRELDLSFNHPGESVKKMLMDLKKDPNCQLDILKLNNCGQERLKAGVKKYFCKLVLDQNTAHTNMKLSDGNTVVTAVEEKLLYFYHLDRFDCWLQVLGDTGLNGRSYWEVLWKGSAHIGVTYKGIIRKGQGADIGLGSNDHSWALLCQEKESYSIQHENEVKPINPPASPATQKVAVFLDFPAGTLTFYKVGYHKLIPLHTFTSEFTEPLYPAFGFGVDYSSIKFGSSVSLPEASEDMF